MSVKKGDSHKSVERQALILKCLAWIGSNFLSDLNYSGRSLEFLYELEILLMVQNFRVGKDLVCSELLRGRMNLCTIKRVITDSSTLPLILSASKYFRYRLINRSGC